MNLKELSQLLGLSQTTVSRALNGYPEVSEATRDRVKREADRVGYVPSVRARGLATGKAMAIGHVIAADTRRELVNPVFGDFIAGAGETYAAQGYDMILSRVSNTDEEATYRKMRAKGNVDGIILHGPRVNDRRIQLLQEIGLPFVVHGRSAGTQTPYSYLDVNNTRAFTTATTHLINLGHRRIGLLNGLEHMDFAIRRRAGFERAFHQSGLRPDPQLMKSSEMTERYGYSATCDWLALANPPTALVTSSVLIAFGVRRAIEQHGLRMGRDISVVTHDDDLYFLPNGEAEPIFTATRSSVRDAGKDAAAILIDQIKTPHAAPLTEIRMADFIIGPSTGPVARG